MPNHVTDENYSNKMEGVSKEIQAHYFI